MNLCLRISSCITFSCLALACTAGSDGSSMNLSSVCVAPVAANAPVAAGANELVTVAGEAGPQRISVQLDGRALDLVDDGTAGDAAASDGVYTTAVQVAQPTTARWCEAIAPAAAPANAAPSGQPSAKLWTGTCRIVLCGTGGTEGDTGICISCGHIWF